MMLVDGFKDFNTGYEDHSFFLHGAEPEKFSDISSRWLLIDIKSIIDIMENKVMVASIKKSEIGL